LQLKMTCDWLALCCINQQNVQNVLTCFLLLPIWLKRRINICLILHNSRKIKSVDEPKKLLMFKMNLHAWRKFVANQTHELWFLLLCAFFLTFYFVQNEFFIFLYSILPQNDKLKTCCWQWQVFNLSCCINS